jgi:hypothetical protein
MKEDWRKFHFQKPVKSMEIAAAFQFSDKVFEQELRRARQTHSAAATIDAGRATMKIKLRNLNSEKNMPFTRVPGISNPPGPSRKAIKERTIDVSKQHSIPLHRIDLLQAFRQRPVNVAATTATMAAADR